MYGIKIIAGHNDCWWNIKGLCTFDKHGLTKHNNSVSHRIWDSKESCTLTQLGVSICSGYKKEIY